jgi:hypothetical protein
MTEQTFYFLKERKSGVLSKGSNNSDYLHNQSLSNSYKENSKRPPKLYKIGNAKTERTKNLKYGLVLDIIPVTLTFDLDNVLEN